MFLPLQAGSASGLFGALVVGVGALLTTLTGAIVDAGYGAQGLLSAMLATSVLSFVAALSAISAARMDATPTPAR